MEYDPDHTSLEKKVEELLELARLVLRSDSERILDEEFAAYSRTREGGSDAEEDDPERRIPSAWK